MKGTREYRGEVPGCPGGVGAYAWDNRHSGKNQCEHHPGNSYPGLDGVIEDFVRLNDQRKDNFRLQRQYCNIVKLGIRELLILPNVMVIIIMIIQTNAYTGGTQSERERGR